MQDIYQPRGASFSSERLGGGGRRRGELLLHLTLFLCPSRILLDAGAAKLRPLLQVDLGAFRHEVLVVEPAGHALLVAAVLVATIDHHHHRVVQTALVKVW